MTLKSVTLITLLFLITCWTFNVYAAWYQVEVIVFDYLYANTDGEEWYVNPGLPERNNTIDLIEAMPQITPEPDVDEASAEELVAREEILAYKELGSDFFRLDDVQHVLKLAREYRPLLHVAWQQPGLNSKAVRAVHLQQFEESVASEESHANEIEPFDIDSLQNAPAMEENEYQVLDLMFDGTIRMRSSRFLHVDVDMAYFPETAEEEGMPVSFSEELRADYVRLRESRKIKLNEIHYFDHPLFGVILRVSRLNLN